MSIFQWAIAVFSVIAVMAFLFEMQQCGNNPLGLFSGVVKSFDRFEIWKKQQQRHTSATVHKLKKHDNSKV
jgi:hypothetical protein